MTARARRRRRDRRAGSLALLACAAGLACAEAARPTSPALPPAGSPGDEESGILARISRGAARPPGADEPADAGPPGEGRRYGGSRYADYEFEPRTPPMPPPAPHDPGYTPVALTRHGAIEGTVVWPRPPRAPEHLPAPARCGAMRNRTLELGPGRAVAGAAVWLEDIRSGRRLLGQPAKSRTAARAQQLGGPLEWRGCQVSPHIQLVAPIGAVLEATAVDEPVVLIATRVNAAERLRLFSLELGAGARREVQLPRSGLIEVAPEGGPAGGAGWLVVAGHPYHTLSDEAGRFALYEVPPGTYTLVVWHEPVITGAGPDGTPVRSEPVVVRRKVSVTDRKIHTIKVELPPVSRAGAVR
ncbi:MAG TPA: carboxypeptidase-like regulatory domain-containing protein [Kofleriaceae bacterium]|nr:carboxypeptidase-like regulatory domain-containing protein [Kofleriaceae bacterium]